MLHKPTKKREVCPFPLSQPIRPMIANYNLSYLQGHFRVQSLVMSRFEAFIGSPSLSVIRIL